MRKAKENTIEIKEDVRVPGTDVILESGDRIEVLKERVDVNDPKADQLIGQIDEEIYELISKYFSYKRDIEGLTEKEIGQWVGSAITRSFGGRMGFLDGLDSGLGKY